MDDVSKQSKRTHFARAAEHFRDLAPERTAEIFENAADVTLVVGADGIIHDAAFGMSSLLAAGGESWTGQRWEDTVTVECKAKVAEILEDARTGARITSREINHAMPDGDDVPIRYSAARLHENGSVIVFGRDISKVATLQQKLMNSQLSIEREFARLRSGEMRYRMIFQLGDVPQVVVDTTNLRVCDVNPAALNMLGMKLRDVDNTKVAQLFDSSDKNALEKLLIAPIVMTSPPRKAIFTSLSLR
ncbi:MAG: PAS domain-containing protein [Pseudomonadota bacterium]